MDGNLPEPHRAEQNLWNAQFQPLNPVPLLLYSAAFRALVISAWPSSWQASPIGELMFNRGAWSALCCASASTSSPQHQDVVDGCSAEPGRGLSCPRGTTRSLGCGRLFCLRAVLNAQGQKKELSI